MFWSPPDNRGPKTGSTHYIYRRYIYIYSIYRYIYSVIFHMVPIPHPCHIALLKRPTSIDSLDYWTPPIDLPCPCTPQCTTLLPPSPPPPHAHPNAPPPLPPPPAPWIWRSQILVITVEWNQAKIKQCIRSIWASRCLIGVSELLLQTLIMLFLGNHLEVSAEYISVLLTGSGINQSQYSGTEQWTTIEPRLSRWIYPILR